MSGISQTHEDMSGVSHEELMAALFAQLVIQQANMATMLMGKAAHPETGEKIQDFEAARMFIDTLEMLQQKTKGNLSKEEEGLLSQSLTALRLAFVEAVGDNKNAQSTKSELPSAAHSESAPSAGSPLTSTPNPGTSAAEEESRKKFTKKY